MDNVTDDQYNKGTLEAGAGKSQEKGDAKHHARYGVGGLYQAVNGGFGGPAHFTAGGDQRAQIGDGRP